MEVLHWTPLYQKQGANGSGGTLVQHTPYFAGLIRGHNQGRPHHLSVGAFIWLPSCSSCYAMAMACLQFMLPCPQPQQCNLLEQRNHALAVAHEAPLFSNFPPSQRQESISDGCKHHLHPQQLRPLGWQMYNGACSEHSGSCPLLSTNRGRSLGVHLKALYWQRPRPLRPSSSPNNNHNQLLALVPTSTNTSATPWPLRKLPPKANSHASSQAPKLQCSIACSLPGLPALPPPPLPLHPSTPSQPSQPSIFRVSFHDRAHRLLGAPHPLAARHGPINLKTIPISIPQIYAGAAGPLQNT